MPQIDRIGIFKGKIVDFGVSVTRQKKLPQFVCTLTATEYLNEIENQWVDWSEYGQTIIGYLCLVTLDEHGQLTKLFQYDAIKEATGWDGETFAGLAAMDLQGKTVQFQITESVYNGTTTLQVSRIGSEEAQFGLRKLADTELQQLDKQFPLGSEKSKPVSATKKTKTPPKVKKEKTSKSDPAKTKPDTATELEAYEACIDANEKLDDGGVDETVLDDYWTDAVTKIAADPDKVTPEEWAKIRNSVYEALDIPF